MSAPGVLASVLPDSLEGLFVAAVGVAIFVAPGAVLCGAARLGLVASEKPAAWFATSLALLTATFAFCLLAGAGLGAGLPVLGSLTALAAVAAKRTLGNARGPGDDADFSLSSSSLVPSFLLFLLLVAAVALATSLAPVGSVDRWWYLAYIRGWIETPALSLDEPFLGTGQSFARFGVHPWLFGLAMWAKLAGADPLRIWDSAAPALVVIASVSAAAAFARALFADAARVRLAVIAAILLWSGALLPLLARAGEDKVMAAAALFPLCCAGFLRFFAKPAWSLEGRRELLLLAVAAVATSAVHALDYAFVLLALLPTAAVVARRRSDLRSRAAAVVVLLLLVGIAPAASGLLVRQRLGEIGAESGVADHPVVRVHEGRERLLVLPFAGVVVHPRLLMHPLVVIALGGWLLAIPGWRRRRQGEARQSEQDPRSLHGTTGNPEHGSPLLEGATGASARDIRPLSRATARGAGGLVEEFRVEASGECAGLDEPAFVFLATTTLLAVSLAFLPPLPSIVGAVIPPWMVYRVLWILPLAPLAAMAALTSARRFGGGETIAALLLAALGVSSMIATATGRDDGPRERVAVPSSAAFHELVNAIAALPADALVVAAPELAERLPALTGRHVAAGLDRSTVVFAGSRERGEARLRARAALLAGDADAGGLATAAGIVATHAVFDPRSSARPSCGRMIHESPSSALCELRASPTTAAGVATLKDAEASTMVHVVTAQCRPDVAAPQPSPGGAASRRDPWSAAAPLVRCLVPVPEDVRGRDDLVLSVEVATGRAADELHVSLHDPASPQAFASRRVRVEDGVAVAFRLAPLSSSAVEVRIASSFLAFVKPKKVAIAIAPQP